MKKIFMLMSIPIFSVVFAQIGTSGGENSNWTFGGYAGLGGAFGNGGGVSLYITPRIGYNVTDYFELGAAGNFTWNNSKYYSSTMTGVGPFAHFYVGRNFYLGAMYQHYFVNQKDKTYHYKYDIEEDALYIGGGYMQKLGDRIYMQIGGMYNILYDSNTSVFSGGFIPNIGIVYGL